MKRNDARIKTLADGIINQNVPATILVEYDGVVTYSAYYIEQPNYKIFLNSSKSVISAISPLIIQLLKIRGSKNIYNLNNENTLESLQCVLRFEGIDLEYTTGNAVTIRLSKGIW